MFCKENNAHETSVCLDRSFAISPHPGQGRGGGSRKQTPFPAKRISGSLFALLVCTLGIGRASQVGVSPNTASLTAGQTQQFTETVQGASFRGPVWSVNGIQGGNSGIGVISTNGLYTAPALIPSQQTVTVTVTEGNKTANASVSLVPVSVGVSVSVTPSTAGLAASQSQQFAASVSGTSNTGISWSINPSSGSISSSGLYTAPSSITSQQTVAVVATSMADSSKSASSSVVLAPGVAISITPTSASVAASHTQQFTASVTGTTNTSVTWSLNPAVGSISSSGLYTAPASISNNTPVTITAASAADSTKTASATVSLTATAAPVAISTSVMPNGTVGVAYSVALQATGGTTPYTWSIASGNLPAGLTLSTTGTASGVPTTAGSSTFTVKVVDQTGTSATTNYTLTMTAISTSNSTQAGGLVSYPTYVPGPTQLANAGFETVSSGEPTGWTIDDPAGVSSDCTVAHSGNCSLKINNPKSYSEFEQSVAVAPGVYSFSAFIQTQNLGSSSSALRICVQNIPGYQFQVCTGDAYGTNAWQQLTATEIYVSTATTLTWQVNCDAPGGLPTGTAWIDDAQLVPQQTPVSVFMLYPNHRGKIFSDQSQIAQFDVTVIPPVNGGAVTDYTMTATVTDEQTSSVVKTITQPAVAHTVISVDMTGVPSTDTYLANFSITRSNPSATYTYPSYRMSMAAGSVRSSYQLSFDQNNRFTFSGTPKFLLGVYDSGLNYYSDQTSYINQWTTARHLFQLPINFYLTYWWGDVPNTYMLPAFQALASHGIVGVTTNNCEFQRTVPQQLSSFWLLSASDADVAARAATPGFGGFYTADECQASVASDNFSGASASGSYGVPRMRQLDPGGIAFGTFADDGAPAVWRDTLDVVSRDPYPIYGTQSSYDLSIVAKQTQQVAQAVMNGRPFVTVLQFFSFAGGPWPTQDQIRNMSYMAIAEGANGLLYWELGQGNGAFFNDAAWPSDCAGGVWCSERLTEFSYLQNVMNELNTLQPALSSLDANTRLTGNSQSIIHTRVKDLNGASYLIAVNNSGNSVSSTFTWNAAITSIMVNNEGRTITPSGSTFTDTFGPYQAHVYVIN